MMPSKLVRQVETILMERMEELPPHQPLPPEVVLAKQIGVSRRTLRNALANLESNERVRRIKRKGTFPTRGHKAIPIFQKRARMIGLVDSRPLSFPFSRLIVTGAFKEASHRGYGLVLLKRDAKENIFQMLDDPHVDGFILFRSKDTGLLEKILERKKPICLVANSSHVEGVDSVQMDSKNGTILAIRHLYELGHRRIAFIDSNDPGIDPERFKGYQLAFKQLNLFQNSEWVTKKPLTVQGGVEGASDLLSLPAAKRPTAILGFSILVAFGAAKAILKRGLRIPEDISVMGGGGLDILTVLEREAPRSDENFWSQTKGMPGLTYLSCDPRDIGHAAVEHLIDRLKNPNQPRRNTLIPLELKIRKSTGKIK
jgi:LacI family transcriptional regulator